MERRRRRFPLAWAASPRAVAILALAFTLTRTAPGRASPEGVPAEEEAASRRAEGFRLNAPEARVAVALGAEVGSLAVLGHHIRYGADGTRVDYRRDANQDTLFFFWRLSGELRVARRHTLIFLYQPFDLQTESVLERELTVGERVFAAGTPMRFGYGFDFYRLAYQFDLFADDRREVAFGGGLQVRNARVGFFSQDGEVGFSQTNLGIVPLLRFRGRVGLGENYFFATEIDGLFTPVPTGRGPDDQVSLGAILDASIRAGLLVNHGIELFLNLRYLGGGYRGDSSDVQGLAEDDAWTANWLHTLTFSLGFALR
jgi:hypothetical protein